MSPYAFGICLAATILTLIGSLQCKEYEIVYGDSSEASSEEEYDCKKSSGKKYDYSPYGSYETYKPADNKKPATIKYTYTFEVEDPKTKKPYSYGHYKPEKKLKYYVKPKPTKCPCKDYGYHPSPYRYVYEILPNEIHFETTGKIRPQYEHISNNEVDTKSTGMRSKRDLSKARKPLGRIVKSYNKTKLNNKTSLSPSVITKESKKAMHRKRFLKPFFPRLKSKTVKRNIEDEFRALEEEAKKLDLTVPEIIQYLPETLTSDFKRGGCPFGCSQANDDVKKLTSKDNNYQKDEKSNIKNESNRSRIFSNLKSNKPELSQVYQTTPTSSSQSNSDNGDLITRKTEPLWYLINPTGHTQQNEKKPNLFGGFMNRNFVSHPCHQQPYQKREEFPKQPSLQNTIESEESDESSKKLDRVIYNMILMHPEFIKASNRGPLANPNLRQQTLEFLEKLIRNRFNHVIHNHFTNYPDSNQIEDVKNKLSHENNSIQKIFS